MHFTNCSIVGDPPSKKISIDCQISKFFAATLAFELSRLLQLESVAIGSKDGDQIQTFLPSLFAATHLRELEIYVPEFMTILQLLSCMPELEYLIANCRHDTTFDLLDGISFLPSLKGVTINNANFSSKCEKYTPSRLNTTLSSLCFSNCGFPSTTCVLQLKRFQGLTKLELSECDSGDHGESEDWLDLIHNLPLLSHLNADRCAHLTDSDVMEIAAAMQRRSNPLHLELNFAHRSYLPSLEDLIRHAKESITLDGTEWSKWNITYLCQGLRAPNGQIEELNLDFSGQPLDSEEITEISRWATGCRKLKKFALTANDRRNCTDVGCFYEAAKRWTLSI